MSDAPRYADWVSLLREDSDYLRKAPAPAFWSLAPYYVGQFSDSACSVATAAMVINAVRASAAGSAGIRPATQAAILDAVGSAAWRTQVETDEGRGATLRELAGLLEAGLRALGGAATVSAIELRQPSAGALATFRDALRDFESARGRWIVVNFYMAAVAAPGDYGHFSPLGAYDRERDRVLVLDVYRQELEPYWVPTERLFAGMATPDRDDGEPRGYLLVHLTGA
jgi:hypothetical protein